MEVSVNYLAVLLAALSTMVVGSLWYSPVLFYKQWAKWGNVKPDPSFGGKKAVFAYVTVFLASLVSAYVLAHVTFLSHKFFGYAFLTSALSTAFWVWLGFLATRLYTHDVFEGRRKKLTLLNAAHELVTFEIMALIIGLMGV